MTDYLEMLYDMGVDESRIDSAEGEYQALYDRIMFECSEENFPATDEILGDNA